MRCPASLHDMPHLTLEYTSNLSDLDPKQVLVALNHALVASGQFEEFDIKSRALPLDTYLVGTTDERRAFVHAKLALLSGRSAQTKNELSGAMLQVLRVACKGRGGCSVQLCAEIIDIDRASYAKDLLNADVRETEA